MSTLDSSAIPSTDEFISAADIARMAKVHPRRVPEWVAAGLIAVRGLPGCRPKYSRSDAERLIASSFRPAHQAG